MKLNNNAVRRYDNKFFYEMKPVLTVSKVVCFIWSVPQNLFLHPVLIICPWNWILLRKLSLYKERRKKNLKKTWPKKTFLLLNWIIQLCKYLISLERRKDKKLKHSTKDQETIKYIFILKKFNRNLVIILIFVSKLCNVLSK